MTMLGKLEMEILHRRRYHSSELYSVFSVNVNVRDKSINLIGEYDLTKPNTTIQLIDGYGFFKVYYTTSKSLQLSELIKFKQDIINTFDYVKLFDKIIGVQVLTKEISEALRENHTKTTPLIVLDSIDYEKDSNVVKINVLKQRCIGEHNERFTETIMINSMKFKLVFWDKPKEKTGCFKLDDLNRNIELCKKSILYAISKISRLEFYV